MKKLLIIGLLVLLLTGCGSKKYRGYWCRYDETATVVILLEDNITEEEKQAVENKITSFENISLYNYYSKEEYARDLGEDASKLDIYASYVINFDSMNAIGTYVSELSEMNGVREAKQVNAKRNLSLYNLEKRGKYTYTDSDEAKKEDIINGKYKIKKGVIVLSPSEGKDKLLYTKDGNLCEDADCTKIYFKSDESCNAQ